ncbi:MAG: F0F1 ATP synthase subunit B [Bacteroidales bacterium]
MELLMPGMGLIFWMTLAFGCVLYILRKYAWKPILEVLNEREKFLAKSIGDAKRIEHEMTQLATVKTEKLAEADHARAEIIARAKAEAERIIEEAKEKAGEEARRLSVDAEKMVKKYKREAVQEVKDQLSALSVDLAEKILKEEFSDKKRNDIYVRKLLDEVTAN